MKQIPLLIQKMTRAVLESKGRTEPALRQAIRRRVEHIVSGQAGDPPPIPDELVSYVDKFTRPAYKINDQDLAQLKAQGYSEDAIFEISVTAAMSAGLSRLI